MADVFISYKRQRHAHAQRLALIFESLGYTVWWDYRLVAGPSFREQIEKEIAAASVVIVLWCAASINSKFVRSEANRADRDRKLVQAYLEPVQAPLGFDEDQGQMLSSWSGGPQADEVVALVEAVAIATAKTPAKTPTLTQALSALLPPLPRIEPLQSPDDEEEVDVPSSRKVLQPEEVFFHACDSADDFAFYVQKFPNGRYVHDARTKMEALDLQWIAGLGLTERDWRVLQSNDLVERLGPKASKAELAPRAKRGCVEAAALLAARLTQAGDNEEAVTILLPFEERAFPRVDVLLGYFYFEGIGVEQNSARGIELTKRAADAGHAVARNNFGHALVYGDGCEPDPQEGLRQLLLAAGDGIALAARNLGTCYRDGKFGHKSKKDALIWYQRAADQGDEWAQRHLEELKRSKSKT